MSKEKSTLWSALRKARKEIHLQATGENNHRKYGYATIEDIENAITEPLEKHGLSGWHQRFVEDGIVYIRTVIQHDDTGERLEDVSILESESPGNQGKGAALTYMRKDAWRCLLRLIVKDDDCQQERNDIDKANENAASAYHINRLRDLINQTNDPSKYLANILGYNKVSSLEELGEQQCSRATWRMKDILEKSKN